ncbi:MAG: efflux RND transporter periplasmic adaptor subunit [Deltaproteobacteria bacterium]|nr:efflux RND transporter periplasmic adaptor subunit [Deltaproteobacteria bacterium]MBW2007861.1 efflux RND transporter periplasmic adaptor subunit [Deltaproteobacteria bacterium]MBW2101718.1 efflux RND transporter periplasmic adaptor subunit [Deltaproteobacteria bacterium]
MQVYSLRGMVLHAFFLCALAVFSGCGEQAETREGSAGKAIPVKRVHVARAGAEAPKGAVEYVGELAAYRKVNVACETGGTIERLYFEKGDKVKKGQLLAEISTSSRRLQVRQAVAARDAAKVGLRKLLSGSRPEEIQMAEAGLREAQAALTEARKNYDRIKRLHGIQAVSDSELDAALRGLQMSRERVEAARQQLALAREGPRSEDIEAARARLRQAEAALALAKDYLKKSMLYAPCDGVIAFREVEEGEVLVIPPAVILTQVVDLSRIKVKFSVGEKDLHIIREKERFPFTVDAIPGETFSGVLVFVSPTAHPVTRSFPVELSVERPDPRMADGMTARVRLPLSRAGRTVKVPAAWLAEQDGVMGVFEIKDGHALFRKVTLGGYYDQRVEIISGLQGGELIITNPAGVEPGDAVKY